MPKSNNQNKLDEIKELDSINWEDFGVTVHVCPKCFELLDWNLECPKCRFSYKNELEIKK